MMIIRLKALIEQADANPPACCATPLELAGQVRVLYRRRQRHWARRQLRLESGGRWAGVLDAS